MTTKLIDTAQAGTILGVNTHRIRGFVRRGYLKDYTQVNPNHKKHHPKLDIAEVKEFKRNYLITAREVMVRTAPSGNGQNPAKKSVELPIPVPPSYLPNTKPEMKTPVQSFNERLQAIEAQLVAMSEHLEYLVGMWK